MPFQTAYQYQPGAGLSGGFASNNPRSVLLSSAPTGLVAGVGGCNVGTFAWLDATGTVLNPANATTPYTVPPNAFISREDANAQFLSPAIAEASVNIPEGFPIQGFTGGDFFAQVSAQVTAGQQVTVNGATNEIASVAVGTAPVAPFVLTGFYVAVAAAANGVAIISSKSA